MADPQSFPRPISRIPPFSWKTSKPYVCSFQTCSSKTHREALEVEDVGLHGLVLGGREHASDHGNEAEVYLQKDMGRERLKRHREEVAGRVSIPDKWGKEELLKDWLDYSSFDALLAPKGLASARAALMADARRGKSQRLRIEGRC